MLNKNGKIFFRNYTASGDRAFKTIAGGDPLTCATSVTGCYGVWVGSGDAEVSVDDYNLEEKINTLTEVSQSQTYGDTYDDNYMAVYAGTYKNNTDAEITVKEVGVFYYNNYTTQPNPFMVARQVINPVTLQPGDTYTFTVTVG